MEIVKDESNFGMTDWWKKVVFENYANFNGRARRAEYWNFTLLNIIIALSLLILFALSVGMSYDSEPGFDAIILMILLVAYALGIAIPSIAVAVRRLHDTGKSGLWYLIGVIPFISSIGGIVLLVFYCLEGDRGQNEYGPDPKAPKNPETNQYW